MFLVVREFQLALNFALIANLILMCVCVCMCVRERERQRQRERSGISSFSYKNNSLIGSGSHLYDLIQIKLPP